MDIMTELRLHDLRGAVLEAYDAIEQAKNATRRVATPAGVASSIERAQNALFEARVALDKATAQSIR